MRIVLKIIGHIENVGILVVSTKSNHTRGEMNKVMVIITRILLFVGSKQNL